MQRRFHQALYIVLGVSTAIAVSACTAGGGAAKTSPTDAAASTPSLSASAPPSPRVTPAATVDAIVVRPNGLDLVDGATTVTFLAYTEPASVFVPALERVLHAKAVEENYTSTDPRISDSTTYEWLGFRVIDYHFKIGGPGPEPPSQPTLYVHASEPLAAGTLPVQTIQGIQAGDGVAATAALLGVTPSRSDEFSAPAETGPVLGPTRIADQVYADAVAIFQNSSGAKTVFITAPFNFGDNTDL